MKAYSRCKLHKKHTKLESYSLGSVYKYVTGDQLIGAHDSINDVRGQTAVVQVDLGIALMNYGIALDWNYTSNEGSCPSWI